MHSRFNLTRTWLALAAMTLVLLAAGRTEAKIDGITGPTFNLTAKAGHILSPDGASIYFWGFAPESGTVQYPGPTLIVNQGDEVTVNLINQLPEGVSILFPGQKVTASGGVPGLTTREAPADRITRVTYTFTADRPGTYIYQSGSHADLQIEMGLIGALIVRPTNYQTSACDASGKTMYTAYGDCSSAFDREVLFLLSEMDLNVHDLVESGRLSEVDTARIVPLYWFINGRNGPDTVAPAGASWLQSQPYNCLPRIMPGERILLRFIGGGRDAHPLHTHGNNFDLIAENGQLLESGAGATRGAEVGIIPDLAVSDFTRRVLPGQASDAIFTWTGRELGWDMHGHALTDPTTITNKDGDPVDTLATEVFAATTVSADGGTTLTVDNAAGLPTRHPFRALLWSGGVDYATATTREVVRLQWNGASFDATRGLEGTTPLADAAGASFWFTDHGKKLPVTLPDNKDLFFGQFYSGSPYLGAAGSLPPGEGGFNPNAGFFFMWHSHNEVELTNNNIFPGGMLSMMVVDPPGTTDIPSP